MKKLVNALFILCCFFSFISHAENNVSLSVGVVYPEVRAPYNALFDAIITGINSGGKIVADPLKVEDNIDNSAVSGWIQKNNFASVVLLGKQSLSISTLIPETTSIVIGGMLTPPNGDTRYNGGIAMAPAPEQLFTWLLRLAPLVKHVHVVYNPEMNGWLIEHAHIAAREWGLSLNAMPAGDLREAAQLYRDLIEKLGPEHAVWLPQDSYTVDQQTTLPLLLKKSWDQKFVLFSSNPAHVQRGALFGLYPDNVAMGERLGRMALALAEGKSVKNSSIEPLSDLLIAVNVRTADHLRLNMGKGLIDTFNLTFPASP